ncbi:MAG: transcriptional regulator [Hyphomicrobium sp.]|jgi:transcriptional regulator with XRE-family HTH domain|nr:MAG: transcriptional regulator [Hyphomicrobium sp.]
MPENFGKLGPIDWQAVVDEALRRRKVEKLTQREHAALASVSIPTIAAFDRGERTLTLAKAFDILRVVGLVAESPHDGVQENFVREAFKRWRTLTGKLQPDSPARFPLGWYRIDYAIEGEFEHPDLTELHKVIQKSVIRHTGWPMFMSMTREEFAPREIDGVLEAWLKPREAGVDRFSEDAAHCDFWRAAPSGRFFLIRGYQEDSQDAVPPGTIFDTTLPIWRLGEALLHAAHVASHLRGKQSVDLTVRLRALYSGLQGRQLRSLRASPFDFFLESTPARSGEAMLETALPVSAIEHDLASVVYPLAASLYERFGIPQLGHDFVRVEIDRFRKGKF